MSNFNVCMLSDSYKVTHAKIYPEGTEKVYSYFESRNGAKYESTVFFGLQYILKRFLEGCVVTEEIIEKAKKRINAHLYDGAFNEEGWYYILEKHDGKLPVRIYAVQEGTVVETNNVLMVIENTDPKCYWLTNYLETLLTHVWAPSTVATTSYFVKKNIKKYLEKTADNMETLMFALHDFGARGVSSMESAGIEGAGHLVNFMGTDTLPAIDVVMDYYNTEEMPAYSVNASEHSIMCSLGKNGEMAVLGNMLDKYPTGILSVVIDSYDYRKFIDDTYRLYGNKILSRDGKVVFRPDSGEPNDVIIEVYEMLKKRFGYSTNSKGYEILNPKVGILWGDGIDPIGINGVLFALELRNISADNIVFGMGGGLLQKINRDTQRFAFKSSYQERYGVGHDIFKCPLDKSKMSKKGRLKLIKDASGKFSTIPESTVGKNLLELVFEDGKLLREMTFEQVRKNAEL